MKKKYKNFIQKIDEYRKGLFLLFLVAFFVFISGYIYLVNTAARNGVRWSAVEKEISTARGTVSELESSYLSLKRDITLSLAYDEGFEDARGVTFVSSKILGTIAYNNDL